MHFSMSLSPASQARRMGRRRPQVDRGAMMPMNTELAIRLLSRETTRPASAMSSSEVAAAAVAIWRELSHQFARLIGDSGIRTVLDRGLAVSVAAWPCLSQARVSASAARDPWSALYDCLARERPEQATEAFAGLFAATIELLGRFIGERLVMVVLHERWPEIFPLSKEPS